MGRERQKKKNRSGQSKVRRHKHSKKKILANPIIASHWNQKETLSQNYRRMGLASKLNKPAGGTEKYVERLSKPSEDDVAYDTGAFAVNPRPPTSTAPDEVQVERDPETGRILRVLDDPSTRKSNPLNDPLNELDDSEPEEWQGFDNVKASAAVPARTDVLKELEAHASNGTHKAPRKQSTREQEWLQRLVEKYGDDYQKMAWDKKLNPMQQTTADIKRRVKKWRESQGA